MTKYEDLFHGNKRFGQYQDYVQSMLDIIKYHSCYILKISPQEIFEIEKNASSIIYTCL